MSDLSDLYPPADDKANRWRLRMQARAMAGMDPTDEQADRYNAGIAERGDRTERMGKLGAVALPAGNVAKALVGSGGMTWLTRLGMLGVGLNAANEWPFPDQPYSVSKSVGPNRSPLEDLPQVAMYRD